MDRPKSVVDQPALPLNTERVISISQPPLSVKISAYIFFFLALLMSCSLILAWLGDQLLNLEAAGTGEVANFRSVNLLPYIGLLLYISVGYGLLKMQSWARTIALLVATWTLCSFPIGTILAGIALYLMYRSESVNAFRNGDYII